MSNIVSGIAQKRAIGSSARKAVLMLMAAAASDDGSGIWTSKANMAADLEMSKRTVQKAISDMIGMGVVSEVGKRACKNGFTVEYQINLEALGALKCTRAADAPVQQMHPTRAADAPQDVQQMHPNRPRTILEPDPDDSAREEMTLREAILSECGVDPISGITGPHGGTLGTRADMVVVESWQDDLGLTEDDILGVVRDVMSRKKTPPSRFSYFSRAMTECAGEKLRDPLSPAQPRAGPRRDAMMTPEEIQAELERDAR